MSESKQRMSSRKTGKYAKEAEAAAKLSQEQSKTGGASSDAVGKSITTKQKKGGKKGAAAAAAANGGDDSDEEHATRAKVVRFGEEEEQREPRIANPLFTAQGIAMQSTDVRAHAKDFGKKKVYADNDEVDESLNLAGKNAELNKKKK